jgi:hypothetical protein
MPTSESRCTKRQSDTTRCVDVPNFGTQVTNSSHALLLNRLTVIDRAPVNLSWDFQVPSSIVRHPTRRDVKVQSEQELEFDRWRTAVDIVRRMREAGISCQLIDGDQTRN